jgi:LemA protein
VTVALVGVIVVLWATRSYREVADIRNQVRESWRQLGAELDARHEIIPYLVATAHVKVSQLVEVIGNACDLASHIAGVREAAQAEARLTAAMNRFFVEVDCEPELRDDPSLLELRRRLAAVEMKIGVLRELYNTQAAALNVRLEKGLGRLLGHLPVFGRAELFQLQR